LEKMDAYNTTNLWTKFQQLPENVRQDADLIAAMRHYDYTVNVSWVMAHYHAAAKHLGEADATGGSDWRKYMHPKYQRRIFFPGLWSADELANWGENL
jgi:tryptophan 2,3-dioxygenase